MAITTSIPTAASKTGTVSGNQAKSNKLNKLQASDFIKMMITQLQNQDPTEPAKSSELLAQMSQIGQLQSSNSLQESLKGLVMQNQIGSAGNLIGKTVQGLDSNSKTIKGIVTSIRVESDSVFLELDTGKRLALSNVTNIAATTPTATAMAG